ncbi:hypothetical protein JW921_05735 [Candidatus Fermentibacterales bacterium]|nr:hypothetical protein [Candidatus Fermentibacterales bacterium]
MGDRGHRAWALRRASDTSGEPALIGKWDLGHGLRRLLPALCAGLAARLVFLPVIASMLPADGLYVDECAYAGGVQAAAAPPCFPRPPAMYLLMDCFEAVAGRHDGGRIAGSLASLVPALLVPLCAPGAVPVIASVMCALDPYLVLAGYQLLPGAWAAALVAAAILLSMRGPRRGRDLLSGLLLGLATLFRGELVLLLPLLGLSVEWRWRRWLGGMAGAALVLVPVAVWNLSGGTLATPAANGGLNAWLGTDEELGSVPPGLEFEELVVVTDPRAASGNAGDIDAVFWERAVRAAGSQPLRLLGLLPRKLLSGFAFPGPGRNLDVPSAFRSSGLLVLLPLPLAALSLALAALLRSSSLRRGASWLFCFLLLQAVVALVFFPAARYRVAVVPAVWFLVAMTCPRGDPRELRQILRPAAAIAGILVLASIAAPRLGWPGTRPGFNHILRAEYEINYGSDPAEAMRQLDMAGSSGFAGADLHNLRGIALAIGGRPEEAVCQFRMALAIAPGSPTAWSNLASALFEVGDSVAGEGALARSRSLGPVPSDL